MELQTLVVATGGCEIGGPTLHLIPGGGTTAWTGYQHKSAVDRHSRILYNPETSGFIIAAHVPLSSQSIQQNVDFIVSRSMSCTEFPCLTAARMLCAPRSKYTLSSLHDIYRNRSDSLHAIFLVVQRISCMCRPECGGRRGWILFV